MLIEAIPRSARKEYIKLLKERRINLKELKNYCLVFNDQTETVNLWRVKRGLIINLLSVAKSWDSPTIDELVSDLKSFEDFGGKAVKK
ncbi:hypothetical protein HCB37_16760 [Listeria booriae]|uniref:hypothetical protein n=1 Tax=Listeria booriae TaxID=1552123 RepID=UPI0016233613|nr:hypothetical protein [Listeria booriae]MBC2069338.1 hypothetical protein [Listeria booriae]MBC2266155.1 hypothetical protein [Listeria booriae]